MIASLQLQRLAIRKELAELRLNGKAIAREAVCGTITHAMRNDDDVDYDDLEGDDNDGSSEFYLPASGPTITSLQSTRTTSFHSDSVHHLHHLHPLHQTAGIERDSKATTAAVIPISSSAASIPRLASLPAVAAAAAATVASAEREGPTMTYEHVVAATASEMESVQFLDSYSSLNSSSNSSSNNSNSSSGNDTHPSTVPSFCDSSPAHLSSSSSSSSSSPPSHVKGTFPPDVSPSSGKHYRHHRHHRHRSGMATASYY